MQAGEIKLILIYCDFVVERHQAVHLIHLGVCSLKEVAFWFPLGKKSFLSISHCQQSVWFISHSFPDL